MNHNNESSPRHDTDSCMSGQCKFRGVERRDMRSRRHASTTTDDCGKRKLIKHFHCSQSLLLFTALPIRST